MGFEPTTASLEGWNSTTELRPPTANLPTHQYFAAKALHIRTLSHSASSHLCLIRDTAHGLNRLSLVGRQGFEPWKP